MAILQRASIVFLAVLIAGCNKSPTGPSQLTPGALTLSGRVITATNGPISNAIVTIADGLDAGKSVTTGPTGLYTITGLQQSTFTINVSADGFVPGSSRIATLSGIPMTTLDFSALKVWVTDTLYRKVVGATVTLLDGPQAGTSAATDDSGTVTFPGIFGRSLRLSLVKDGFDPVDSTVGVNSGFPPGSASLTVQLETADLVQLSGKYSVTLAADGSCPNIPIELQTRTYTAVAAPQSGAAGGYMLRVDGTGGIFYVEVSGRDVQVEIGDDFGPFYDPIGLGIYASVTTTVTTPHASLLSGALGYTFLYKGEACGGHNGLFTLASQ